MSFSFVTSYIALWALAIFQGLVALALLRQLAELRAIAGHTALPNEDSLPVGTSAPDFEGFDWRDGRPISSRDIHGRGAVMLFFSACPTCIQLADDLRWATATDLAPIMAFCLGGEGPCSNILEKLPPHVPLLLKNSDEIARRYRISSSPTAVVVDSSRVIRGHGHPGNIKELEELVVQSLAESATAEHGQVLHPSVAN